MTKEQLEVIIQRLTPHPNQRVAYLLGGCAVFALALNRFLTKRQVPNYLLNISNSGHWMLHAFGHDWDIEGWNGSWSKRIRIADIVLIQRTRHLRKAYKWAGKCFFPPNLRIVRLHTLCLELAEADKEVPLVEAITQMLNESPHPEIASSIRFRTKV